MKNAASIILAVLFAITHYPVSVAAQLTDEQQDSLRAIATRDVPEDAPGIAVGVVLNGEIVLEVTAGYADLATKTPIGNESRFNIASNGKQFTALAVLLLEQDGKLSLEDDFRQYLPGLYPEITVPIRIRDLLSHTSGIRDVYDLWAMQGITWWETTLSNVDVLDLLGSQRHLNFEPGTEYAYSNSNYILLTRVIEAVSGRDFVEFTNDMFEMLGMFDTSFVNNHKKHHWSSRQALLQLRYLARLRLALRYPR